MQTLRELRKSKGYQPHYVAEQLGISYNQLFNLEIGKNKVDRLKVEKLMEVFRIEKEELIEILNNTYKGEN